MREYLEDRIVELETLEDWYRRCMEHAHKEGRTYARTWYRESVRTTHAALLECRSTLREVMGRENIEPLFTFPTTTETHISRRYVTSPPLHMLAAWEDMREAGI